MRPIARRGARRPAIRSLPFAAAVALLASGSARAEETPPAPAAETPQGPTAETPPAPAAETEREGGDRPAGSKPSLDFDLLGDAAPPPPEAATPGALRLRRKLLTVHQGAGLGLAALQLATTVVGQLNYSDRFHGGPDTARYRATHKALAYTTLGVFVANGALALLAPSAGTPRKLDRVMVHRVAMFTAAAGMAAQAFIGIRTRERAGRLDQERLATTHLAVGYATLAAVSVGVGVLVF